MEIEPKVLFGHVTHKRLFPKRNQFSYRIYNFVIPLSFPRRLSVPRNSKGLISFHDADHGACDGSNLEQWAREILTEYGFEEADGEIVLVCMPRVLGYVFNPVSFWMCLDRSGGIRAVLCEVHNTFGERHTYLCAREDHQPITAKDTLVGQKLFHVSPFLERNGLYQFKFKHKENRLSISINYLDDKKNKQLETALSGELVSMDRSVCRQAFWKYPLVTLKATLLIHWQAARLVIKGIRHRSKPSQNNKNISATNRL